MPHTSGPWTIEELLGCDTEDGNAETHITAYANDDGKEGASVAWVNRWSYADEPAKEESHAIARLIAAAPDLLEALLDVVARNEIQNWFNLDKARAAIKKAVGK